MSVAQTRSARKKIAERYGKARRHRSVGEAIEEERRRAARDAAVKKKRS